MKSKFNLTNPVSLPFTLYVTMSTVSFYTVIYIYIFFWIWRYTNEFDPRRLKKNVVEKIWKFDFVNLSDKRYGLISKSGIIESVRS